MNFDIAIHMRAYSMNLQAYRIVASFVFEELTKDLRYKHQPTTFSGGSFIRAISMSNGKNFNNKMGYTEILN